MLFIWKKKKLKSGNIFGNRWIVSSFLSIHPWIYKRAENSALYSSTFFQKNWNPGIIFEYRLIVPSFLSIHPRIILMMRGVYCLFFLAIKGAKIRPRPPDHPQLLFNRLKSFVITVYLSWRWLMKNNDSSRVVYNVLSYLLKFGKVAFRRLLVFIMHQYFPLLFIWMCWSQWWCIIEEISFLCYQYLNVWITILMSHDENIFYC